MPDITTLKNHARRIPFAVPIYRWMRERVLGPAKPDFIFERLSWPEGSSGVEARRARLLNVLGYTKSSGTTYSAKEYPAGYHQIKINGETFAGQRNPHDRLNQIPYDFRGKSLLDIGCNQGGMVFSLQDKVKWAVGIDFDHRMINSCNLIRSEYGINNTSFYVLDIDEDPHDLILDFLPERSVDVVFLLSVCMWVDKWREIIRFSARISDLMVFEANGTDAQQSEQIAFLQNIYHDLTILAKTSEDDPKQKQRQLVIAQKNGAHPKCRIISRGCRD